MFSIFSLHGSVFERLRDCYDLSLAPLSFLFPGRNSMQTETAYAFLELKFLKARLSYFIIFNVFDQLTIVCTFFSSSYFSMNFAARMYYSKPGKGRLRQVTFLFCKLPLTIVTWKKSYKLENLSLNFVQEQGLPSTDDDSKDKVITRIFLCDISLTGNNFI